MRSVLLLAAPAQPLLLPAVCATTESAARKRPMPRIQRFWPYFVGTHLPLKSGPVIALGDGLTGYERYANQEYKDTPRSRWEAGQVAAITAGAKERRVKVARDVVVTPDEWVRFAYRRGTENASRSSETQQTGKTNLSVSPAVVRAGRCVSLGREAFTEV